VRGHPERSEGPRANLQTLRGVLRGPSPSARSFVVCATQDDHANPSFSCYPVAGSGQVASKIFRGRRGNNNGACRETQHHRATQVSNKRAIHTQGLVPEETAKRKQTAIAKDAQAPTHRARRKLRRLQAAQRQSSFPNQPVNQNGVWRNGVSANGESAPPQMVARRTTAIQLIHPGPLQSIRIATTKQISVASNDVTTNAVPHGASYVFTLPWRRLV
jgi:hypothetical protein